MNTRIALPILALAISVPTSEAVALCGSDAGCATQSATLHELVGVWPAAPVLTGADTIVLGKYDAGIGLHYLSACINGTFYMLKDNYTGSSGPVNQLEDSFFCAGAGDDHITVLTQPITSPFVCQGRNMYAWGYGGHQLQVFGQGDNDTIYGGVSSDMLCGGGGNDYLDGRLGDDQCDGWSGNDRVYGHEGNDALYGYSGDDRVWDYSGNDSLAGESGASDCVYDSDGVYTSLSCGGNGATDRTPNASGTGCTVATSCAWY